MILHWVGTFLFLLLEKLIATYLYTAYVSSILTYYVLISLLFDQSFIWPNVITMCWCVINPLNQRLLFFSFLKQLASKLCLHILVDFTNWHSLYLVSLTEWLPLINWAEIINHVLKHNFRLLSYFHLCYSNNYDSSNNMYTTTFQCLHKRTIKNNCMNWQRALDYKPRILQWIILNLYNH